MYTFYEKKEIFPNVRVYQPRGNFECCAFAPLFRLLHPHIQGISRVIISAAELKMQPTIHFQS
jgi:hypothetical protein